MAPGLGQAPSQQPAYQHASRRRESLAPLKKAGEMKEARLEELNAILPRIDAALAEPGLYDKDVARATKLQRERAALVAAIAAAEEAWLARLRTMNLRRARLLEPLTLATPGDAVQDSLLTEAHHEEARRLPVHGRRSCRNRSP